MSATAARHRLAVAVRRVDDDEVALGVEQRLGPRQPVGADAGRGTRPEPALSVLAGVGKGLRPLDVLDRDEADAAVGVVDHHELLDPVPVEEPLRLVAVHVLAHRDQVLGGHDLAHRPVRVGLEADVAVGEDADQPAAARLDHGDAGDAVLLLEAQRLAHRAVGRNGQRVDDHAGLELLDPAHLLRLGSGRHVLVDDAEAASLRHGNGEAALGHSVHRGGEQRDAEADFAGDPGVDRRLGRQHRRGRGDQGHVVEGERLSNLHRDPCRRGAHYTQIAGAAKADRLAQIMASDGWMVHSADTPEPVT